MEKRLNKSYVEINREMEINIDNLNISEKVKELFKIIVNNFMIIIPISQMSKN